MNKDRILILKNSERRFNYSSTFTFYDMILIEYKSLEKPLADAPHIQETNLVILDFDTMDEGIACGNDVRKINPYMPMLFIVDAGYKGDLHQDIDRIQGLGNIDFVYPYENEIFSLTRSIEALLHPSLPSKREELAIVIPVFNESERFVHVSNFVRKIKLLMDGGMSSVGLYIIDDGSKDETTDLVETFQHILMDESDTIYYKNPINLKKLNINTRKAGTYLEAFRSIDADYIVTVDADDSFKVEDLVKLLHMIHQGYYDMVIATKDQSVETRTISRKTMSFFKRFLTKPFLPAGVTDSQTGLKVFKAAIIHQIFPYLNQAYGLAFDLEILYLAKKMKLRVKQQPVEIIDREGSHVNMIKDTLNFLKTMLKISIQQEHRKLV